MMRRRRGGLPIPQCIWRYIDVYTFGGKNIPVTVTVYTWIYDLGPTCTIVSYKYPSNRTPRYIEVYASIYRIWFRWRRFQMHSRPAGAAGTRRPGGLSLAVSLAPVIMMRPVAGDRDWESESLPGPQRTHGSRAAARRRPLAPAGGGLAGGRTLGPESRSLPGVRLARPAHPGPGRAGRAGVPAQQPCQ
jgi:hypothetical protein